MKLALVAIASVFAFSTAMANEAAAPAAAAPPAPKPVASPPRWRARPPAGALRPRAPRLLVDREYLLYACGLLGAVEPQAALELALKHLATADEEIRA